MPVGVSKNLEIFKAISMVMIGCCINVFTLEKITLRIHGAAHLITFLQFLFVSAEGFIHFLDIFDSKFKEKKLNDNNKDDTSTKPKTYNKLPFLKPMTIPLKYYLLMVMVFFTVSVVNNKALDYKIALPLHMIFRSGSLIANMLLGIILLSKRYSLRQCLAVVCVSIGIFITVLFSIKSMPPEKPTVGSDLGTWLIGISMLTFALIMSAFLGILQEYVYKLYTNNIRESMFYSHAVALPFFLVLSADIINQIKLFNNDSWLIDITLSPELSFKIPYLWFYLSLNVITQYACIRGVFILTGLTTSLTCTLIITIRKFVSLLISIVYFKNPFSLMHYFGTMLVFGGTFFICTRRKT